MTDHEYLTVQEVADIMRVSSMSVYRFMKAGEIPYTKAHRTRLVSRGDFEAYLEVNYTPNIPKDDDG